MKVWAAIRDENRIIEDRVMDFPSANPHSAEEWGEIIGELCHAMDLSRPVILKKHQNDLNSFRHTSFSPADFMEPVRFHKFTIELFPEKKKESERHN